MDGDADRFTREPSAAPTASASLQGTVREVPRRMDPEVGSFLGSFRVEGRLGEGGLGIVYRAYDEKLKREVALKVLVDRSASQAAALLEEARAAASLTHPAIAAIHDVQQWEGLAYIVMELVSGTPLRAQIKGGPIPWRTAVRYARDVAAGLARAHQGGIVHRDLKPENVMITPEGGAKILDFGLARAAADAPPSSRGAKGTEVLTGIAGTPSYMAPEQARGRRVDARADVFSFGVMLYEMLAAKRPFPKRTSDEDGSELPADAWRVVEPLDRAAPGVPQDLVRIVGRCLELEKAARFADGGELLTALQTIPVADAPAQRTRGLKVALFALAGVAVIAVAGGGVLALRAIRANRAAGPAAPVGITSPRFEAADPHHVEMTEFVEQAKLQLSGVCPSAVLSMANLRDSRDGTVDASRSDTFSASALFYCPGDGNRMISLLLTGGTMQFAMGAAQELHPASSPCSSRALWRSALAAGLRRDVPAQLYLTGAPGQSLHYLQQPDNHVFWFDAQTCASLSSQPMPK